MRKGKILQISAVSTTIDKQLRPLIEASVKEGYEVHIACADDGNIENLRSEGFIVHRVHFDRKISFKSNLKSIIELRKLMRFYKYDIVHVHTPVASILGRIAAKLAGIRNIIYTAHGYYFHEGMSEKQYIFYYQIEKQFAKFVTDYLLLQSKEDYELSVQHRFKNEKRIIHLGNGIDIYHKFNPDKIKKEHINKVKNDFGIEDSDFIYAFIGRFVREKGIYELVEAFNKLNSIKPNMKLLLIGGLLESERDQDINQALERWKGNPNIIFTGLRKDIPELLSVSNVFILPSYREGLPRSIIEAMAMKKPVIATNIRGCREEVIDEETGYLIEKKDINELYEKMLTLYDNKELCLSYGEKAREIVEKEYDEEKVLEKQIELFNSLSQH
ncbi:glycosyltransferase [Virgibacillus halodenitrificans]|nr:glycosyltransferase [Virgibacillus halodenitrificans]